ncbi:hypothetical protein WJX81_001698 [Elliptochloris bilobata]|uniref:Histone chaperone domain-containing protein n=1 Tax=Elliptochloris bilobata TaxID=381761 RepID=A0AAW1RUN1_9CHLO
MDVDMKQLKLAVRKRKDYFLENLQTMSLKDCRAVLEKDLNLAASALKPHRDYVKELVDKVVLQQTAEAKEDAPPPQKRARKADKAAPAKTAPAKAKSVVAKDSVAAPAYGPGVERLRRLCRAATIPIPPNAYRAAKAGGGEAALAAALEALLAKHGLHMGADRAATDAVRARLQLQKDLDGMDVANIVEGGRGRRHAAACPAVNYAAMTARGSDLDESEQSGSETEEGNDNRAGNRPASAKRTQKAKGAAKQRSKAESEERESDASAGEDIDAVPSAGSSGSDYAADGVNDQDEEEEEAAEEASGSESGGREGSAEDGDAGASPAKAAGPVATTAQRPNAAASGGATGRPSESPAPQRAGVKKRVLVLSDDKD